jgi:DNA-directed RNA polymerase subunit M/transcription elongation factor TFIIS
MSDEDKVCPDCGGQLHTVDGCGGEHLECTSCGAVFYLEDSERGD